MLFGEKDVRVAEYGAILRGDGEMKYWLGKVQMLINGTFGSLSLFMDCLLVLFLSFPLLSSF